MNGAINQRKVMIIIDTGILGGPGKGVLQFLQHETSRRYSYVLCGFQYRRPKSTQFVDAALAANCDLCLLPQRFRFDPLAIREACRIARAKGVALVQSHGYKSHLVAQLVSNHLNLPWLAMTHGWTREDWKVCLYNSLERRLLKRAEIAAVVSPPLLEEIATLRGPTRPTRLILNAVDPDEIKGEDDGAAIRRRYGIPGDRTLLGIFGRLSPEKGVLVGLDAFARVARQGTDSHLIFVGDGPLAPALHQQLVALRLIQRVTLAGYQSEMRGFYKAIDLLVIPSLSEGLPNVLLEAMALGLPSVCTRVGAIPDILRNRETGWLVPPGDASALAGRLSKVILAKNHLQSVGAAAQESLYPRFSPAVRVAEFLSIYDELIDGDRIIGEQPCGFDVCEVSQKHKSVENWESRIDSIGAPEDES
jgi:glycosyltransferase involved in cell wall biosynthesis